MTAAERGGADRWPDAMERLLGQIGLPVNAELGTAMMPPASLRAHGALPVSMASHAQSMPQCSGLGLPETRSGRSA